MGDPKTVLEGSVKYRDKKKWKSRWAVVSKLSPVADCLHIQLYRDSKERCKQGPTKASLSLEGFLCLETGFTLDKESQTLALLCAELAVVLAFDSRELLIQWQVKVRANLPEEQQFLVQLATVPTKSKLPCGPARLHLQDHTFCLVSGVPPRLLGVWPIKELRRFGVIEGRFCFEGGSLCGKGEGLHVLLTNQLEELSQAMDLASKGKLLGKRKTLSRKNSVLESSSRSPLHKHRHSGKGGGCDAGSDSCSRPLLSSGSDGSTCDACSDMMRSSDTLGCPPDDLAYLSAANASLKASSCRIHYRWPSCFSRWGQSSTTTTTSDAESMDTVSVTLSDFQGLSTTISKANGHGQSMSCLCDSQGTWPFKQCTKCGRHFYSRNSLQSNQSSDSCKVRSPEDFSPQWTMDSVLGSSNECGKDRLMKLPSDRASLCSRASHSSNGSTASSSGSGSEYSVPKNFLESLYDRPKSVQHALNGNSNKKPHTTNCSRPLNSHSALCENPLQLKSACACHESNGTAYPFTTSQENMSHRECTCWNGMAASVHSELDMRMSNGSGGKSASANPSPNSSPKRRPRFNTASGDLNRELPCTCSRGDPYANYAVPRSACTSVKDKQAPSVQMNSIKDPKMQSSTIGEDYDVPKKITDMLSNCDTTQKTMKATGSGTSCSCMSACRIVQNVELIKMASKHSFNHHHQGACDSMQMCACQRVMLWAGSLVPCLGPQRPAIDSGWQCGGKTQERNSSWRSRQATVCSEPSKTAEVVMVNGKPKHRLHGGASGDFRGNKHVSGHFTRPRANTVACPMSATSQCSDSSVNYANLEFSAGSEAPKCPRVSGSDSNTVNYTNIEFAEPPLYENSNTVLSRLEQSGGDKHEVVVAEKPPLPPRTHQSPSKSQDPKPAGENSEKCSCKHQCIHKSPKRNISKQMSQMSGSAYELMCFQKNYQSSMENYLLMQPLCRSEQELTKPTDDSNSPSTTNGDSSTVAETVEPSLPLRPFMPYSYPGVKTNGVSLQDNSSVAGDMVSRKQQLISEDAQLRAVRSNSLSELKKKVLMRKRSCSIDGKNNDAAMVADVISGVVSTPASPVGSPRPSMQRKNSLFSKLNLRSKEKSMSTNEIPPPIPLTSSNGNISYYKSNLHRSADCLKLNEDYANSDEDLNSDNSDFTAQKESLSKAGMSMKRSSSVPCRAGATNSYITSPVRTNGTICELNDLNKEKSLMEEETPADVDEEKEVVQRKYSLDSHERPKRIIQGVKSNCDNVYRRDDCNECDTVMEMQAVLRRPQHQTDTCRSAISSCSSSDISDYMESLSFISRSSSSSSGSTSSTDYMRAEDICLLRPVVKPPIKCPHSAIPTIHQSRPLEVRSAANAADDSSSSSASCNGTCDVTVRYKESRPIEVNGHNSSANIGRNVSDDSSTSSSLSCNEVEVKRYRARGTENVEQNRTQNGSLGHTRDSTSSTSSLSSSPGLTDYSSSTSSSPPCEGNLLHISKNMSRSDCSHSCKSGSKCCSSATRTIAHQTDV